MPENVLWCTIMPSFTVSYTSAHNTTWKRNAKNTRENRPQNDLIDVTLLKLCLATYKQYSPVSLSLFLSLLPLSCPYNVWHTYTVLFQLLVSVAKLSSMGDKWHNMLWNSMRFISIARISANECRKWDLVSESHEKDSY